MATAYELRGEVYNDLDAVNAIKALASLAGGGILFHTGTSCPIDLGFYPSYDEPTRITSNNTGILPIFRLSVAHRGVAYPNTEISLVDIRGFYADREYTNFTPTHCNYFEKWVVGQSCYSNPADLYSDRAPATGMKYAAVYNWDTESMWLLELFNYGYWWAAVPNGEIKAVRVSVRGKEFSFPLVYAVS